VCHVTPDGYRLPVRLGLHWLRLTPRCDGGIERLYFELNIHSLPAGRDLRGSIARRFLLTMAFICMGLPRPVSALEVPILVYHRFGHRAPDSMTVRTQAFEAQMHQLDESGFHIIPLRQLVDHLLHGAPPLPPKAIVLTVDDGHRSVYTELMPIALRRRMPVTLFIYPSAISNASYALTWAQLAKLRASGLFDIQSHAYWHPNFFRERRRLDPAAYGRLVDDQLTRSKQVLEARLGSKVEMLAWPFGQWDAELEAHARRAGYVAAFTLERRPAREGDDPLGLPRYLITETVGDKAFAAILRNAMESDKAKDER
jgi:peptidoglycan/xylan/chitin deacetylase (PgdA/CDA1 family)